MTVRQPIKLFFSYAHEDHELRDKLESHLRILEREGALDQWSDVEIRPGQRWEPAILEALEEAQIILLLVSSDFLASEYCHTVETSRALEREEAGEARVIPVILRPCLWDVAAFSRLQALPTGAKAISLWEDQDQALADVARGIRVVVDELRSGPLHPKPEQEPPLAVPVGCRLAVYRNEPLRILGEDYDPFRAFKQVFEGAQKGAYPELPEIPLTGPVDFVATSHRRILAELRRASPSLGLPYDLVAMPYRALGHCVAKGLILPLDEGLTRRHAATYIWWREMGMIEDRLYGVPLSALTQVLAIRNDLFAHHGLTPPDSWEAYVELIRELEPGTLPVAPELLQGRCHVTLWYDWLSYLYACDTNDLVLYRSRRLTPQQAAESLRKGTLFYLETAAELAKHADGRGPLPHFATANWDDGIACFSQGQLLMHLLFNDAIETLRERMRVSAPDAEVRFLPIPTVLGAPYRNAQVEGWVLTIPSGSHYYWPAVQLLDWFLDEAVQTVYARWGGASAHRQVIDRNAAAGDAGLAFRDSVADFVAGRSPIDLVKLNGPNALSLVDQIVNNLHEGVLAVATGQQSPEKATEMLLERVCWYLRVTGA